MSFFGQSRRLPCDASSKKGCLNLPQDQRFKGSELFLPSYLHLRVLPFSERNGIQQEHQDREPEEGTVRTAAALFNGAASCEQEF